MQIIVKSLDSASSPITIRLPTPISGFLSHINALQRTLDSLVLSTFCSLSVNIVISFTLKISCGFNPHHLFYNI